MVTPLKSREGVAVTCMVTFATSVQLPLAAVTVNVSSVAGLTLTLCVVTLNALEAQVYDVAPLAVKVVLLAEQIVVSPLMASVGVVVTLTVIVFVPTHVALELNKVYVVLLVGLTFTVLVFTLPALALQVYEDAPLAVNVVL